MSFTTSVIGSLPRPKWLVEARESEYPRIEALEQIAIEDAINLQKGIDVITDGEQSRSSFVSFVGGRIPGFRTMRIEELHPDAIDILRRSRTQLTYSRAVVTSRIDYGELIMKDLARAKGIAPDAKFKVTLPDPYLVMWECWHSELSKAAYPDPVDFAEDYAKLSRRLISELTGSGAFMVQLDSPMLGDLTEGGDAPDRYHEILTALYGQKYRGFKEEKALAVKLLNSALSGRGDFKIGVHMDRWPNQDSPYFGQGYERLMPEMLGIEADQFALEYTSQGCGDPAQLAGNLKSDRFEFAVGCVSVRDRGVETPQQIAARVKPVADIIGGARTWLVPDCGFAPGMYRPFPNESIRGKFQSMVAAAEILRKEYGS